MKLSIWQQFSSNHSNSFTIVGQFASESDAINAVKKLEDAHVRMHSLSAHKDGNERLKEFVLIEFSVTWQHTYIPDWVKLNPPDIEQYRDIVFVHHVNNWSSASPIALMIEKLGAITSSTKEEVREESNNRWRFEFDISDEEQADAFEEMILGILTTPYITYDEYDEVVLYYMRTVNWQHYGDEILVSFERDKSHFSFDNVTFDYRTNKHILENFIENLKAYGATDIKHQLIRN